MENSNHKSFIEVYDKESDTWIVAGGMEDVPWKAYCHVVIAPKSSW